MVTTSGLQHYGCPVLVGKQRYGTEHDLHAHAAIIPTSLSYSIIVFIKRVLAEK